MIQQSVLFEAVVHVKCVSVSLAQEAGQKKKKNNNGRVLSSSIDAPKNSKQRRRHLKTMTSHVELEFLK